MIRINKKLDLFNCLFLGYDNKKTSLIKFLKSKKIKVILYRNKILTYEVAKKYDIIISFGYRRIIAKEIIAKLNRPIINLHISYLPYNRGAHSNFWSFINKTQKGVTIHEIDHGIDTGNIIFRKKIKFKINNESTFASTYKILILEIEKLFKKKYKSIFFKNYKSKKQLITTKLNLKKELPSNVNWNSKISEYLHTYKT
jgi:methionyl-tRNA formyltransferase